ncbi:hypothetical protein ACS0TY_024284 [Phlomoides rotata]
MRWSFDASEESKQWTEQLQWLPNTTGASEKIFCSPLYPSRLRLRRRPAVHAQPRTPVPPSHHAADPVPTPAALCITPPTPSTSRLRLLAPHPVRPRARDPANRPAFEVRLVQVVPIFDGNSGESVHSRSPRRGSIHPPPAFGSSPNLEALALEAIKSEVQDGDSAVDAGGNISSVSNSTKYCCILQPRLTDLVGIL